jgi:hypothetical protein
MITSFDDLITNMYRGNFFRSDFDFSNTNVGIAGGRWVELMTVPDGSGVISVPVKDGGTSKSFVTTTESQFIEHCGSVAPASKHLINGVVYSHNFISGTIIIVDVLGYYPGINVNSTTTHTFSGSVPTRYTEGVMAGLYITDVATSLTGAASLTMTYTNSDNVSGRTVTQAALTSPGVLQTWAATPYLNFASGDKGIKSVQSLQFTSAMAGNATATLFLFKPIATIPMATTAVASERDFVNQSPYMAKIADDACLSALYLGNTTTTIGSSIVGSLEFAWG